MYIHQWDDMPLIEDEQILVVDFEEKAHRLGIHLFPSSRWPFMVCIGILFLALAAAPFAPVARIVMLVIGVIFFGLAIAGWMLEDVRLFPADDPAAGGGHGGAH
jgi:hypothetical protein